MDRDCENLPMDRENQTLILKQGKRAAFMTGGNSLCRYHIRSHWDIYKAKCKETNTPLHHHAIPREIWLKITKKDGRKRELGQQTLVLPKVTGPKEFT